MRLGLHRMSGKADDAFRAYVEKVRPPGVKFLNPGGGDDALAAWCVARGVAVIGRVFFDPQLLGAGGARQVKEVAAAARACANIKYWELHNESWSIPGEMARYAALSIDFMKAMEEIGRIGVIGCFSEGTPQVDGSDNYQAWREYLPAVNYAITHGHVLGLHEYSGPMMTFDTNDPAGSHEGWHTLRYRKSLKVLKALGADVSRLKIAITESGVDDVNPRPGPTGKGWRDYDGTEWARPPLSPEGNYAGQQYWYCGELSKDPQIVMVVDFGWAHEDPTWRTFDLAETPEMLERLASLQLTLPRGGAPAPVPVPTPPGGNTVSNRLSIMLRAEFGELYDDLRGKLRTNPSGPNGPFGYLDMAKVDGIAVHHTAGPESITWESTAAFHVDTRKFAGIGYHLGIRQGRVALFDEITTARAHVLNENHHLLGIVFAGNYQTDTLDPADVALLRRLVKVLDAFLARQVRVGGHRDFAPPGYTVCPGSALYAQVSGIRAGTDDGLKQALGKWADLAQAQGIQPNPGAALFQQIIRDLFYPLTDEGGARGEWPELDGYPGVVPQLARSMSGGAERIYYWQGGKVHRVDR